MKSNFFLVAKKSPFMKKRRRNKHTLNHPWPSIVILQSEKKKILLIFEDIIFSHAICTIFPLSTQ